MPLWLQWIIGTGAGIGAIGVIWTKLIRPLGQLISYLHAAIPLNQALVTQFKDNSDYFPVLKEIAGQFKTDSGSTLRDIVNGLATSADEAKIAAKIIQVKAEVLEVNVGAVKELSIKDRAEAAHRLVLLDEVLARLKRNETLIQEQLNTLQAALTAQAIALPAKTGPVSSDLDTGSLATVLVTAPVADINTPKE
jgi:hypothetical protein